METGLTFLHDLIELSTSAPTGKKGIPGSVPINLLDALVVEEENFLATLLGLEGNQSFQKSGSPELQNPLSSEPSKKKINFTGLLDLLKDNLSSFENPASLGDVQVSPLETEKNHGLPLSLEMGMEDIPVQDVMASEIYLEPGSENSGGDVSKFGTEVLKKVSDFERVVAGNKNSGNAAHPYNSSGREDIGDNSPRVTNTGIKKNESEVIDPDKVVVKDEVFKQDDFGNKILLRSESDLKKNEVRSISPDKMVGTSETFKKEDPGNKSQLQSKPDLKGSELGIKKQGSEIQNATPLFKRSEAEIKNSNKVVQMHTAPEKEDTLNKIVNKMTLFSKPVLQVNKESEVKLGEAVAKDLTGVKKVNTNSENMEQTQLHGIQKTQSEKYISETAEGKVPSDSESALKQIGGVRVKLGSEHYRASIFKSFDTDSGPREKVAQANGLKIEQMKIPSEISEQEIPSRSESGLFHKENGKSEADGKPSGIPTHLKQFGTDTFSKYKNLQVVETVTGEAKTSGEEKNDLHRENILSSEQGEKDRFVLRAVNGMNSAYLNPDSRPQYMNAKSAALKTEGLDQDMSLGKVVKPDAANGENAHMSSQNQSAEKGVEYLIQAKETGMVQKPFHADVMSQLVSKAVMNLKNGQTSIKINLKPEVLGQLRMQITTENNQVMVKILTEAPLVKEIIESNVNQLRAELQSQGLEIEKFNVSLDKGSEQNQGAPEKFPFRVAKGGTDNENKEEGHAETRKKITPLAEKLKEESRIDFFA